MLKTKIRNLLLLISASFFNMAIPSFAGGLIYGSGSISGSGYITSAILSAPTGGGGGGRTVFASDNFTAANATNLAGRTPDLGGTWTDRDTCACEQIFSNALSMTAGVSKWSYYVNTAPASADYDVEAVISQTSAGQVTPGVAGRIASGADTQYFLYWDGGTTWHMYKFVGGSATSLGTFAGNTPTSPVTIRLSMTGTTIAGLIAGTQRISVTDSAISAAGFAGVKGYFPDLDSSHIRKVDTWAAYQ